MRGKAAHLTCLKKNFVARVNWVQVTFVCWLPEDNFSSALDHQVLGQSALRFGPGPDGAPQWSCHPLCQWCRATGTRNEHQLLRLCCSSHVPGRMRGKAAHLTSLKRISWREWIGCRWRLFAGYPRIISVLPWTIRSWAKAWRALALVLMAHRNGVAIHFVNDVVRLGHAMNVLRMCLGECAAKLVSHSEKNFVAMNWVQVTFVCWLPEDNLSSASGPGPGPGKDGESNGVAIHFVNDVVRLGHAMNINYCGYAVLRMCLGECAAKLHISHLWKEFRGESELGAGDVCLLVTRG